MLLIEKNVSSDSFLVTSIRHYWYLSET